MELLQQLEGEAEQSDFPSLEEILSTDLDEEEKSARRDEEKKKQEDISKQRVRVVDEEGKANAVGKRKASVANVVLWQGDGTYTVNGRRFSEYFPNMNQREEIIKPFLATSTLGQFNVSATAQGGGLSGQAGAVRLGISRALQFYDPGFRSTLKVEGLLTRDARVVERKKTGKRKARKSPQWSKR
eukprot:jgi/Pico_ML_1/52697/g3370.t1